MNKPGAFKATSETFKKVNWRWNSQSIWGNTNLLWKLSPKKMLWCFVGIIFGYISNDFSGEGKEVANTLYFYERLEAVLEVAYLLTIKRSI